LNRKSANGRFLSMNSCAEPWWRLGVDPVSGLDSRPFQPRNHSSGYATAIQIRWSFPARRPRSPDYAHPTRFVQLPSLASSYLRSRDGLALLHALDRRRPGARLGDAAGTLKDPTGA
jgi:hypothetical protein